jgi:hypothetical protein
VVTRPSAHQATCCLIFRTVDGTAWEFVWRSLLDEGRLRPLREECYLKAATFSFKVHVTSSCDGAVWQIPQRPQRMSAVPDWLNAMPPLGDRTRILPGVCSCVIQNARPVRPMQTASHLHGFLQTVRAHGLTLSLTGLGRFYVVYLCCTAVEFCRRRWIGSVFKVEMFFW